MIGRAGVRKSEPGPFGHKWELQLKTRAGAAHVGVSVRPLSGLRCMGETSRTIDGELWREALFCDQRLMEAQREVLLPGPERQ